MRLELDHLHYLQGFTDITLMPEQAAAIIGETKKRISCPITLQVLSEGKLKDLLIAENNSTSAEVTPYLIVLYFFIHL